MCPPHPLSLSPSPSISFSQVTGVQQLQDEACGTCGRRVEKVRRVNEGRGDLATNLAVVGRVPGTVI